tara:strand:- start:156 stop:518 length:363 start_codon:yes stop_codon:yes gene_type:complete
MAYSQAIVIAGGLAHIPVLTGIFWYFDRTLTTKYQKDREKWMQPKERSPKSKPIEVIQIDEQLQKIDLSLETNSNLQVKSELLLEEDSVNLLEKDLTEITNIEEIKPEEIDSNEIKEEDN